MRRCVWSRNLKNVEAVARVGPQRYRKKKSSVLIKVVLGSSPGGGEIFRTRPDHFWGPPTLAAGTWRWQPTPSSADANERVELYLYSPLGLHGLFYRFVLPLLIKAESAKIVFLLPKTQPPREATTAF